MAIEQIYCTHCTYGTSALEQREGELADRVLGYSARAGSLDRNELRNDYRAIERFLYYYLPSDTPPEDKQRLDAAAAPRRLFFCPAMGKLQMVGQVAYRQYDTAGRLGSYFAHVLFGDHVQGSWSAADCLRLWHAPWIEEDTAEHPYKLPSLETLDQLWAGKTPLVNDDAVLDFLQTVGRASSPSQPDGLGRPPHDIVDARWHTVPEQQRIDLLVNTLQGLLNLGNQRRENILLVVEPGVAALVFYGVVRLLPKSLSSGLSFSTYEPNAERLPVTLAATTFFDPYNNDVRPDLYRRRGLVINTFQDRISEAGAPPGDYARFIVDRLLEEGWPTVDRLISAYDEAGARRPEDVELLARTHRVSMQVLSASPPEDDGWRKSEVAVRYLQREVQHQLVNAPAGWPQLHKVIGSPNHLTVLELVAGDGMPAELQRPAQFLLKKFPPEKIADLANSPLVAQAAKLEALVAYVTAQNRLPQGCQLLPADGGRLKPRPASEALLGELLVRLPEPVLRRLGDSIAEAERMVWFGALVDASAGRPPVSPHKKMVLETIARFSDAELLDALVRYREPVLRACPPPEPVLAKRLGRLLYELPKHSKSFEKWLSVLLEWKGSFTYPHLAEQRLGEWHKFLSCLLALREPGDAAATGKMGIKNRLRSPPRAEYKPLAEALNRAMRRRPDEFQELHDVAARSLLNLPQFKERLTLAARHTGLAITFDDQAAAAPAAGDDLFSGPADEVGRLHQQREQQHRMLAMFHELEERLLIYADDGLGSEKLRVLQQIGQLIVGRPDFLGPGRQMIEAYFSNGGAWSGPVLLSGGAKSHGRKYRTKRGKSKQQLPKHHHMLIVAACAALAMMMVGYYFGSRNSTPPVSQATTHSGHPSPPADTTGAPQTSHSGMTETHKQAEQSKPTVVPSKVTSEPRKPVAQSPGDGKAPSVKPNDPTSAPGDDAVSAAPVSPAIDPKEQTADGPPTSMLDASRTSRPHDPEKKVAPSPTRSTNDASTPTVPSEQNPESNDPQPAVSSQAESDSKKTKSAPAIVVEECCSLPVRGSGTFSNPKPVKKWTDDPGIIKLSLKGLKAANRRLDDRRSRLETKSKDDRFSIVLVESAGNGDSTTIAMLTKGKNELSFQWTETTRITEPIEEARTELRRCVVEIAGENETSFISLMTPLKREALHISPKKLLGREEFGWKIGAAKLDLQGFRDAQFQFRDDDELQLGRGVVRLGDSSLLPFGENGRVMTAAPVHDLPEKLRESNAQVVVSRSQETPLDGELRLVSDATTPSEHARPLTKDEQMALETLKEFRKRQQTQLDDLVTRAPTVTATIYRRVEADLYAPCLVLGDPTTIPDDLPAGFGDGVDDGEAVGATGAGAAIREDREHDRQTED